MTEVLLYRVENNLGEGPYRFKTTDENKDFMGYFTHHNDATHPSPTEEPFYTRKQDRVLSFDIITNPDLIYSFGSLLKLKSWFNSEDRNMLAIYGFNISLYKVKEKYINRILESSTQTLFEREWANKVKTISITEELLACS